MFHLTLDLELYDPLKKLNENVIEKFNSEQEIILKKIFLLLNENTIKISCFVTNEFVDSFYDFFHKYVVEKHEVGCHTANHLFYNEETLTEFIQNIRKNKTYLEKETGLECKGFRAPGGIVPINLITILKKMNFKYDSSVVPGIMPGRFNHSKSPKEPYFPDYDNIYSPGVKNMKIIEFPLLTSKMIKLSMNGFFFSYYNRFINLKKYERNYGTTYLHPYDFKKFNIFDKSFLWDKIKDTNSNWRFLCIYVQKRKNTDNRLCNLYRDEIERLGTISNNKL